MKIYLASPLGFSELGRLGLAPLKEKLKALGHTVYDPWDRDQTVIIDDAFASATNYKTLLPTMNTLSIRIGDENINAIEEADCVFAVLDGQELDSGTVSELAYAVGRGKLAHGYRGDFRDVDGLPGVAFNLQVLSFIKKSGGQLFRSLNEINF